MEPKIPTLKDSKKPQVKVRGLEAGVTLFDRLKQFKKKDLAFILAGLGTLFMAPLAEHFMMAPEGGDSALNAGFGGGKNGGGHGLFDNGSGSVGYDVSNGQAPGSAVGGGSDVITPLNVRDPSALVMGPGATQQPSTQSQAPSTPPPTAPVTRSDSDLKDALAASARGIGSAAHAAKALLPVPKIGLTGAGGLRGLGVANGGSSASSSLSPISSNGLATGKANTGGGMAGVKNSAGVKGVARGQSQGGGGLEALKAAAGNAGNEMNRGAASTALDNAAAQAIPTGGSNFGGGGQGGAGANDKAESGNGGKDNKSTGESLEFLKQKALQEKKIELWAKEQEAGDNKLEMLKMRNSIAEAIAGKIGGAVGDAITCPMTKGFKKCWTAAADLGEYYCKSAGPTPIPGGSVGNCGDDGVQYQVGPNGADGLLTLIGCTGTVKDGSPSVLDPSKQLSGCTALGAASGATPKPAGGDKPADGQPGGVNGPAGPTSGPASLLVQAPAATLGAACIALTSTKNDIQKSMGSNAASPAGAVVSEIDRFLGNAAEVVALRDALGNGKTTECSSAGVPGVTTPVATLQNSAISGLTDAIPGVKNSAMSNKTDADPYKSAKAATDAALQSVLDAKTALDAVDGEVKKAQLTDASFVVSPAGKKGIAVTYVGVDAGKDPVSGNLKTIADAYSVVMKGYKNAGEVQALLQSQAQGQGQNSKDVYSAVVKVMGDTAKGSGTKEGEITTVINQNAGFTTFGATLRDASQGQNVAAANFTLNNPDAKALDNSKAGKDDVAASAKTAGDAITAAKNKLADYESAPDKAPDTTKKTDIQTKFLDGDKGVTKAYTNLWKVVGGDIGSINTALSNARSKQLTK